MSAQQLERVIDLLRSHPLLKPSVEETRATFEEFYRPFPVEEDVRCERVMADTVEAEWITAPGAADDRVLLYLHGGGFVFCSVNTHRGMLGRFSRFTSGTSSLRSSTRDSRRSMRSDGSCSSVRLR